MKNIVVIGGGTAGWLSALFFAKNIPGAHITVIESSSVGILGAGEGVVPSVLHFLEDLDINLSDLFREAKATFKNGIKFTNWNGDGTSYYHPFSDTVHINDVSHLKHLEIVSEQQTLDSISYTSLVSDQNKVKIIPKQFLMRTGTMADFDLQGTFAIHFDATLLASYLKRIGVSRGIVVVDDVVKSLTEDNNNCITEVNCVDNTYTADFIVDCTGLHRLVIGNHYEAEWVDWSKFLPNKKALPFSLPVNDNLAPYTESIAMKYGWVWKIPIQDRYGCGYVYDSDHVTDDEVREEIKNIFGVDIDTSRNSFTFHPGYFKTPWVKNCLSIGLSSGFFEPLEATNIWVATESLIRLVNHLPGLFFQEESYIQRYNEIITEMNEEMANFILLHYITDRDDTEYWLRFKNSENLTKYVNNIITRFETIYPFAQGAVDNITNSKFFTFESYLSVCNGNRILKKQNAKLQHDALILVRDKDTELSNFKRYHEYLLEQVFHSADHRQVIEYFKGKYEN